MAVLKIESIHPYLLEEVVEKEIFADEVCDGCPVQKECLPLGGYSATESISFVDSLLGKQPRYVVNVYGYKAGGSECLLTKENSPIKFKQVQPFK